MTTVGIFTASAREFLHVRPELSIHEYGRSHAYQYEAGQCGNVRVLLIRTGIGPYNARHAAEKALEAFSLHAVIITGFACALKPATIGDLIIGDQTFRLGDTTPRFFASDPILIEYAERSQRRTAIPSLRGTVVTIDQIIWKAEGKRNISVSSQATGLDMESAELAKVATVRGTPCLIVRAVSDLLDEDLPLDFNLFNSPIGILRGVASLIRHPSSFMSLYRLKKQTTLAASHLSLFLMDFLPMLDSLQVPHGIRS